MPTLPRAKVLIDLSPLDTPSRLRGIGQYILGLVSGIQQLANEGELKFDIDGIAAFDEQGQTTGVDGLSYQGTMVHPEGFPTKPYRRRKRLGLIKGAASRLADLIHITEPGIVVKGQAVPRVVTGYDVIPLALHKEYLGKEPWARLYCRWKETRYFSSARRIVAISHATRNDLVSYLGIDENLIDVAHLGVDHAQFQPEPLRENERQLLNEKYSLARPFLFYIGAFDSRKNIDLLMQAFADSGLAKEFELVLAGAMLEKRKLGLSRLASQAHVEGAVRLLGYVDQDDIAALYRACHAHIFPSKYEGFGLPVAEALACGAPTLTTNVTSMPEIAGSAAALIAPSNKDALVEGLKDICQNESLRARLRRDGPLQAAKFTWVECARQTVKSYRKALGSQG